MTTRKKPTEKSAHASVSRSAKAPVAADSRTASVPKGGASKAAAKPVKASPKAEPAAKPGSSAKPAPLAKAAPAATKAPKSAPAAAEISSSGSIPAPKADSIPPEAPVKAEPNEAVAALLADPAAASLVGQEAERLVDARANVANQAAATIAGVFAVRPELVVPHVGKLAKAIVTKNKKVVQVCAEAMPAIAKVAPARVARELDFLRTHFRASLEEGQDGLVRTFATLCIASVAYQKRLEPILTEALSIAEGKTLLRWTQAVLPSLKGEPHARARAVVEGRLDSLPRPLAQPIADFLGIKLRAVQPRR